MKISIVIPVFNNSASLNETKNQIVQLFNSSHLSIYEFEIIFVNDGSRDNSLDVLQELKKDCEFIKIISFTRNFGQLAAISAGFQLASGDAVVTLSADLQDPIELMSEMIRRWSDGVDSVICFRVARNDGFFGDSFSRVAYALLRLSVPNIPPGGFDYCLVSRRVVELFNSTNIKNRFFQGDILWGGYSNSFIPYERKMRLHGKSQYTFWKKSKYFLDALLDASYLPIRAISTLGVLIAILGFLYALILVINKFIGGAPFEGWSPIMISIMVVGGLNMLMLGIVGEYIWRIYDQVRGKPSFVIDRSIL